MSNIVLSPSQQVAEQKFRDFLQNDEKELVISGFAGSGKSFLVQYFKKAAEHQLGVNQAIGGDTWNTHYTATTNKAATVLSGFLGEPVRTIHNLLGLRVTNDLSTGRTVLKPGGEPKDLSHSLIYVDEASMISRDLLRYIRGSQEEGTKYVFIGDRYQLAPVQEGHSPVFRQKNIIHLKEIQRQAAGSPIIMTSQKYRQVLDNGKPSAWPEIIPDGVAVHHVDGPTFQALVDQKYSQPHDPDDLKILAWSNERVLAYNKHVRSLEGRTPYLEPGEYAVSNKPIFRGKSVLYPTDRVVQIADVLPRKEGEFEGFEIKFASVFGMTGSSWFLPKDWKQVNAYTKHLAKHKNWPEFFRIKDNYLDLRSPHSLTCHKAQGSTYREVFVDLTDIGRNNKWDEIARLVYVAISRASHAVYLYGELPIRNWKK